MFTSLKRKIVGWLNIVIEFLRAVPGTEHLIAPLEVAIGALGGVAIAHGGVKKSLSAEKLLLASSVLSLIIALSPFVSELQVAVPVLSKVAAFLAAFRFGKGINATEKNAKKS